MKDSLEYGVQKRKHQSWIRRNLIDIVGISSIACTLALIIYYVVNN